MTGTAVFDLADELEATAPRHVRVARDAQAVYIWNIQVHDVEDGRPRVLFGDTSAHAVPYPRGFVTISGTRPACYETGAIRVLVADGVGMLQQAFDAAAAAGDPLTAVRARLLDRSAGLEPPIVTVVDEAELAMLVPA
jgi:hypothetical protein